MSDMLQLVVPHRKFNFFPKRNTGESASRHDKLKHIGHLVVAFSLA
jgi:hypothetical protein